jgi:hypothetical protein
MRTITVALAIALLAAGLSAQQPAASAAGGRMFLLVLDDLHVDFRDTPRTRRLLKQIVDAIVRDGDMIAVVNTGLYVISEGPTVDIRRVEAAINGFVGAALRPAEELAARQETRGRAEPQHRAYIALSRVLQLVASREDTQRPAAVVYVSNGHRRTTEPSGVAASNDPTEAFSALVRLAKREAIPVYAFSPRDVVGSTAQAPDSDDWRMHLEQSREMLRALATETGGIAVTDPSDLEAALAKLRDFGR